TKAVLGNCLAEILATLISFAVVFIITLILIKLIFFALDFLIKKIPVVKQANGVLGAVAGLLNGFIWTWAVSNIFVKFVLPLLNYFEPNIFIMEIADSYIINLCTKINPITYLFWLINLIS
ncbi:MAG: CvpA family protein, partial [Clostridia bacterium]|nr:CvpA family protein [Clostridia bacterium]